MSFFTRLKNRLGSSPQPPAVLNFSTPIQSYPDDVFVIPVLIVRYFPVRDGWVDIEVTGDVGAPLDHVRRHTVLTTERVIHALETGSIYHGYKDPAALPSLRYHIVDALEYLEPLPSRPDPRFKAPLADYHAIMQRIDIRRWVEERGVKEIWLWGYHDKVISLWESNMAGPYGDISNSDRNVHDLPVLDKTYTVYHYNYQRDVPEAVEDHMHQIEAVLRHVDPHLFWDKFVGKPGEGRCGWSHFPPNGERDYDWANPKYVWTDIEDWTPEGAGPRQQMNFTRWHGHSLTWFIYWMQNLPGRDNRLSYLGRRLTNWWTFSGDFDGAMASGLGLVEWSGDSAASG
jgi:hypothetical protein